MSHLHVSQSLWLHGKICWPCWLLALWRTAGPCVLLPSYASLPPALADVQCKTQAKADIILLVDGSWSIGRLNFKTIRAFIGRMVGVFDIGPDKVQIGEWGTAGLDWGLGPFSVSVLESRVINVVLGSYPRSGSVQRRPQDRVAPKRT